MTNESTHGYVLPIHKLTADEVYGSDVTAEGNGTRHKHNGSSGAPTAFHQIDWVDPDTGIRYTGAVNVQVQTMDEQVAAKGMGKDAKGNKLKFRAADFVKARAKAEAAD